MSIDLFDFIRRYRPHTTKSDKIYHLFCDTCGKDRGYNAKNLAKADCASCSSKKKLEHMSKEEKSKRGKHARAFRKQGLSEQTKQKIGLANTGKKRSLSQRIKNSASKQRIPLNEWKGFVFEFEDPKRSKFKLGKFNLKVFQRDNFTCKICGKRGGELNAHHLNNWKQFPIERYKISNLVTLCKSCHRSFHSEYGTRNNIKEQFEEFLKWHKTNG
jgi:hypothetical protein